MRYSRANTFEKGYPCKVFLDGSDNATVIWFDVERGEACVEVNPIQGQAVLGRSGRILTAIFRGDVQVEWEKGRPPVERQLTITVEGERAAGKTTIKRILSRALADAVSAGEIQPVSINFIEKLPE